MPRSKGDLKKKTLNLREGDWEKMEEMFPDIGPSKAVRLLLSRFVDKNYTPTPKNEVDLAEDLDL